MENKIIETKQEYAWTFIHHYLLFLDSFAAPQTDDEYKKLLYDLQQYVDNKIDVEGEIKDYYVTVLYTQED